MRNLHDIKTKVLDDYDLAILYHVRVHRTDIYSERDKFEIISNVLYYKNRKSPARNTWNISVKTCCWEPNGKKNLMHLL